MEMSNFREQRRGSNQNNSHRSQGGQEKKQQQHTSIIRKVSAVPETASEKIIPNLIERQPNQKIEVISIGGLGEIGKNTWAFKCNDQILVVDAGLGFPTEGMYGVDLVLPDLAYLIENQDKIVGMIITHGHEDHIGGIPNLLRAVKIPIIYGPPLAVGLIENKLKDHGFLKQATVKRFKNRETIELGCFAATMLRNNHSIPDSFGFALQSPAGFIVHSGDFKFDHTPVDGELFDIVGFAEASTRGVDLFISDSTNAERSGYSPSEKEVQPNLDKAFIQASKRIIITTFASQVHRIGQILELAQKHGRKVAILGRSMLNIALISRQLGYMNFPDGLLIKADEINNYPLNKICILSTGSQGEPLSALTRISNGSHRQISIIPGDTVVVSATPIPGNERSVASMINALSSRGAHVIYGHDAGVHVSGHASQEEQKLLFNIVKPKNFMPAHGEYRMLVQHGETAKKVLKLKDENVFVMSNGDVLEISTNDQCETSAQLGEHIPVGIMMVDSNDHSHSILAQTIEDRYAMSVHGIVNITLTVDKSTLASEPDLIMKGLAFNSESESIELRRLILGSIKDKWNDLDSNETVEAIRDLVSGICKIKNQKPIINVLVLNVEALALPEKSD